MCDLSNEHLVHARRAGARLYRKFGGFMGMQREDWQQEAAMTMIVLQGACETPEELSAKIGNVGRLTSRRVLRNQNATRDRSLGFRQWWVWQMGEAQIDDRYDVADTRAQQRLIEQAILISELTSPEVTYPKEREILTARLADHMGTKVQQLALGRWARRMSQAMKNNELPTASSKKERLAKMTEGRRRQASESRHKRAQAR